MTTFVLSAGTGVPSCVSTSAIVDILEKPGRGAGEALVDAPGAGLPPLSRGAGRVMNPVESSCGVASLPDCFFLFFFSVFPFESG